MIGIISIHGAIRIVLDTGIESVRGVSGTKHNGHRCRMRGPQKTGIGRLDNLLAQVYHDRHPTNRHVTTTTETKVETLARSASVVLQILADPEAVVECVDDTEVVGAMRETSAERVTC